MTNLLDLPHDVLTNVLSHIDFSDYVALCHVDFIFFKIFGADMSLKYQVERQIAGVDDNPNSNISINERSWALQRSEDGWDRVEFDFKCVVEVEHEASALYALADGFVVVGDAETPATLHYFKLPSSEEDVRRHSWNSISLSGGDTLHVYDIDVAISENDLIAVATSRSKPENPNRWLFEIQLLQFSTGQPHPFASTPMRVIAEGYDGEIEGVAIQVAGRYLAFLTFRVDTILCVIDWMTSRIQMSHAINSQGAQCDVIFLSENFVLLSNPIDGALEIHMISNPDLDFKLTRKTLLSLRLPRLASTDQYQGILFESDPRLSPSGIPHSSRPFHTSSKNAIIAVTIEIETINTFYQTHYVIFVHRSSLLDLATNLKTPGAVIDWETWGPSITRWFDHDRSVNDPVFSVTVAGQHCALVNHWDKQAEVTVLDFNPLRVRKSLYMSARAHEVSEDSRINPTSHSFTTKETIFRHGVFKEVVRSTLTYRKTLMDLFIDVDENCGILLDEERAIKLIMNEDDSPSFIEIFHFGPTSTL